ncbi:hypothetical protein BC834DRAFT_493424 [Gloeopeniophorella convolvens]|nr:hypothetical protein BC834DRAFT_493424 [Gloeopeniophorella convolvens]
MRSSARSGPVASRRLRVILRMQPLIAIGLHQADDASVQQVELPGACFDPIIFTTSILLNSSTAGKSQRSCVGGGVKPRTESVVPQPNRQDIKFRSSMRSTLRQPRRHLARAPIESRDAARSQLQPGVASYPSRNDCLPRSATETSVASIHRGTTVFRYRHKAPRRRRLASATPLPRSHRPRAP